MIDEPRPPSFAPFTPVGTVEPHAGMLTAPPDGQLLYKVMSIDNFERSLQGAYLHFTRVDKFGEKDPLDGAQPPKDRATNVIPRFEKAPKFSAADYYDKARTRTYVCCFSLEMSQYLWDTYSGGGAGGAVCVVFDFSKLRALLCSPSATMRQI